MNVGKKEKEVRKLTLYLVGQKEEKEKKMGEKQIKK